MKYHGRIFIPLVAIVLIALWHSSYFLVNNTATHAFLITDGFIKYDFIYTPFILPFFWWMGKKYDEAHFYSERDPLTRLYNRRFLWTKFPVLLERADKSGQDLHIFVLDINDFKKINDTHGHEVGDRVVQDVAVVLLKHTSQSSVVTRWGGDEFLVIMFQSQDESRYSFLEMIQRAIKDSSHPVVKDITISIGSAIYPYDAKLPNELIRIADERMYEHKLRVDPF